MAKYVTRAHIVSFDNWVGVTADQVIIEDEMPRDSGLLDANGDRLYRMPEKVPFGFHHHRPTVRVKAGRKPV